MDYSFIILFLLPFPIAGVIYFKNRIPARSRAYLDLVKIIVYVFIFVFLIEVLIFMEFQ